MSSFFNGLDFISELYYSYAPYKEEENKNETDQTKKESDNNDTYITIQDENGNYLDEYNENIIYTPNYDINNEINIVLNNKQEIPYAMDIYNCTLDTFGMITETFQSKECCSLSKCCSLNNSIEVRSDITVCFSSVKQDVRDFLANPTVKQTTGLGSLFAATVIASWLKSDLLAAFLAAILSKCGGGTFINTPRPKKAMIGATALLAGIIAEQALKNTSVGDISFFGIALMLNIEFISREIKIFLKDYDTVEDITDLKDMDLLNIKPEFLTEDIKKAILDIPEQSSIEEIRRDLQSLKSLVFEGQVVKRTKIIQQYAIIQKIEGENKEIEKIITYENTDKETVTRSVALYKKIALVGATTLTAVFGTKYITDSVSLWAFAKLNNLTILKLIKDFPYFYQYLIAAGTIGGAFTIREWNAAVWPKKLNLLALVLKKHVNENFGIKSIYEDDEDEEAIESKEEKNNEILTNKVTIKTPSNYYGRFKQCIKNGFDNVSGFFSTIKNKIGIQTTYFKNKLNKQASLELEVIKNEIPTCMQNNRISNYVNKKLTELFVRKKKKDKLPIGRAGIEATIANVIGGSIVFGAKHLADGPEKTMLEMGGLELTSNFSAAFLNRFPEWVRILGAGGMVGAGWGADKLLNTDFMLTIGAVNAGEIFRKICKEMTMDPNAKKKTKDKKAKKKDKGPKIEEIKDKETVIKIEDKNTSNLENKKEEEIKIEEIKIEDNNKTEEITININ